MTIRDEEYAWEAVDALASYLRTEFPKMRVEDIEPALFLSERLIKGYEVYGSVHIGKVRWREWALEERADEFNYLVWQNMEDRGELPTEKELKEFDCE